MDLMQNVTFEQGVFDQKRNVSQGDPDVAASAESFSQTTSSSQTHKIRPSLYFFAPLRQWRFPGKCNACSAWQGKKATLLQTEKHWRGNKRKEGPRKELERRRANS